MKYAKWISVLLLLFVPLIATAQLSQSGKLVTQVPFKFMVGNVAMPAGEVTVQTADEGGRLLIVRNRDAKVACIALAVAINTSKAAQRSAMVFHRYGDRYFLDGVRAAESQSLYTLRPTKLEKELRAQNVPGTELVLLASAK